MSAPNDGGPMKEATLRDYFATNFAASLIKDGSPEFIEPACRKLVEKLKIQMPEAVCDQIAYVAYAMADRMILARGNPAPLWKAPAAG